jgi:Fe-S cluster assembly protein SufD
LPVSTILHSASPANDDQILSDWHVVQSSSEPEWLKRARRRGHEVFLDSGLPTRKLSNWKYTDLSALRGVHFLAPDAQLPDISADRLPTAFAARDRVPRLVFVNGRFQPELSLIASLPGGLHVASARDAVQDNLRVMQERLGHPINFDSGPMVALNTALFRDGAFIAVDAGTAAGWIELVFVTGGNVSPTIVSPRSIFVVGEHAQLGIVEHHLSLTGERYVANSVTDIQLKPSSRLLHHRFVAVDSHAVDISVTRAELSAAAAYENCNLVLSGGLTRLESQVHLNGERAEANLCGAYIVCREDHCDNTVFVEHGAPHTRSRQVFKGIIGDKGRGVFQSKVLVDRCAHHADGSQLSKALLMSDEAEIDQQPALEIFADEVKCSHGAACGHVDDEALFYLRSRGLPEHTARQLLLQGFLEDVVAEVSDDTIRDALRSKLKDAVSQMWRVSR